MTTDERLQALEEKVLGLEKEVSHLKHELSKRELTSSRPTLNQTASVLPKGPIPQNENMRSNPTASATNQAVYKTAPGNQNRVPVRNTVNQPVKKTPNPISASKKTNLETTIGKNVIGILASVLFFIAFIVFGTYIYQNLGDMGKSILLFIGSFLITGVGLLLHKKFNNAFSLSVIGCGMGCFYITLIINTVYFEFLSELGLYGLLLIWLFGTLLISKKLDSSFLCVIGQCGLYISILFGVMNKTMSEFLWFSFFVFFLVADILYLRIFSFKKREKLHTFSSIGSVFSCFLIALRNQTLFFLYIEKETTNTAITIIYFILMIVLAVYSFYYFYRTAKEGMTKNKSALTFLASLFFFCAYYIYEVTLDMLIFGIGIDKTLGNYFSLLFILLFTVYLIFFTEKHSEQKLTNFISILNIPFLLFFAVIYFFGLNLDDYSLLLLLTIPLLIYGFYKGKNLYQGLGFVILFVHIWTGSSSLVLHFVLTMATFFLAFWLQKKYLSSYSGTTKAAIYLLFLIYCLQPVSDLSNFLKSGDILNLNPGILYVCFLTPLQIFASKTDFIKNYKDLNKTEKHMEFLLRSTNMILLLLGVSYLYDSIPTWTYLLLILATSILCFAGVKQFLDQHTHKFWSGLYIGLKFTIYLSFVFYSTPIANKVLFSILLLCIAIVAILIGFRFEWKSLRIYGLFLTMISVIKLIQFDIDYSSTLGTVLALMISGVLCFIINFIYNMLSKHIITEEPKPTEPKNQEP